MNTSSNNANLLNLPKIKNYIDKDCLKRIKQIKLFDQINSTNTYLLELAQDLPLDKHNEIHVCLAERQLKGKGRLGRQWVSPFGANLYLSMLYSFAKDISDIAGLGLVVATTITDMLESIGIKNLGLKWPNDVLWQKRKLAGVLIEIASEAYGVSNAVIGVGLNVAMPTHAGTLISQPWVDLCEITNELPDRNRLAGLLINNLVQSLGVFRQKGIKAFMQKWQRLDICMNQPVCVITPNNKVYGIAKGVDANGRLRLENEAGKILTFSSGEISLRF
jgi:BirA family biotin operon repressor/biotin-[acetyl-CoA-carboxylase] ligase